MKKGIVIFLALACNVYAQSPSTEPTLDARIEAGKNKAEQMCFACHGKGGVSAIPMYPSLAGQGAKYLEKQLRDFKSDARPNIVMKGQAGLLTDEEMVNISLYYASLPLPQQETAGVGENPDEILKIGEALFRGGDMTNGIPACSACHLPNGIGIAPSAFPALAGQHATYTRSQLEAFKASANMDDLASDAKKETIVQRPNDPNGMMRDIAKKMTPKQIEAVSLYIQGLR